MNDWLATLDAFSSIWADAMVRACWQGGLAILLVWGLCCVLARMPPAAQCWLWRLVYLKLFVALLCATPIALPLLPAPGPHAGPAAPPPTPAGAAHAIRGGADDSTTPNGGDAETSFPSRSGAALPPTACWLLMPWFLATGWSLVRVIRAWHGVRHLLANSQRVTDPQLAASLAQLSRQLGLRRVPALKTSDEISSPSLLGVIRPAIFLPASLLQACSPTELRLALAHELAHLKRRDLLWNWLPTLAGVLFFFHPMVWLAQRQWRLSQELACDEMAASASRATAADLGRLLLQIAFQRDSQRFDSLLTAEVSTSFSLFQRRLSAMKSFGPLARSPLTRRRSMAVAATVCLLVGLGGVVPWQVTARENRTSETNSAAATPSPADTGPGLCDRPKETAADTGVEKTSPPSHAKQARRRQRHGRVAVVDIDYLLRHHEGLDRNRTKMRSLCELAETEVRQQREQIVKSVGKLEALRDDTLEHQELEQVIADKKKELDALVRWMRKRFIGWEAKDLDTTYGEIVDVVRRFAKEHDISVVYRKEAEADPKEARDGRNAAKPTSTTAVHADDLDDETRLPAGARRYAAALPKPKKGETVDQASVIKRINSTVVYQQEDRWDITGDILEMLNRQQTQPQRPDGDKGAGELGP